MVKLDSDKKYVFLCKDDADKERWVTLIQKAIKKAEEKIPDQEKKNSEKLTNLVQSLRNQINNLTNQIEEEQKKASNLKEEVTTLQIQLEASEIERKEQVEKVKNLEREIKKMEETISELKQIQGLEPEESKNNRLKKRLSAAFRKKREEEVNLDEINLPTNKNQEGNSSFEK